MFTWLLGIPFLGSFIQIITPAIKGIVEGVVEWAKACWHGLKTSNYGTWTLLLTVAALVYMFTPCPEATCTKASTAPKSVIGKTSPSTNSNDTFLDWFRLH